MKIFNIIVALTIIFCGIGCISQAYAQEWQEVKGKHFVVYYTFKQDRSAARLVLRRAEEYYRKIASQIGYSRYSRFWTWEERAKIIIFPNQRMYVEHTGQPGWSRGYADRYSSLFRSRTIVTYRQEVSFVDGVLPHEIAHLILWDFIGFDRMIPLWFEEGVAQLQEVEKKKIADQLMKIQVRRNNAIPFEIFFNWDIRQEKDPQKVTLFYAQSVSVIEFLVRQYGSAAFGSLCRSLKEGKTLEEAVRLTYRPSIVTTEDFENKWIQYMKR